MTKIDFSDSIAKAIAVTFGLFHTEKLKKSLWFRLVLTSLEAGPMRPSRSNEVRHEGMQEREIILKFRDEDDDVPENNLLAVVAMTEERASNWVVKSVQFTFHNAAGKPSWLEIDDLRSLFPDDGYVRFCPDYVLIE